MAYKNERGELPSKEYENVIYSGNAKNKLKIIFGTKELENADMYCERLVRKSIAMPETSKKFYLNNFIAQTITCTFYDLDISIIQEPVKISIGTLVNNVYEYVPLGIFNIQDKPITDRNKITLKLIDNADKFNFYYDAKPLMDLNNGKATLDEIFVDICEKAGVDYDFDSYTLAEGMNKEVGIYDNTILARHYIEYIAENSGTIPVINRNGELVLLANRRREKFRIPLSIIEKYEVGDSFKINKAIYEDGVRKYEFGKGSAI